MNSPVSVLKSRAFQMALLVVATIPSFGAQPAPPTNLLVDALQSGKTIFSCDARNFFNDGTNASSTPCAVGNYVYPANGFTAPGGNGPLMSVENGVVYLAPPGGGGHNALSLIYQQKVNVQAFTATFTFVPNGKNLAFVLQDSDNNGSYDGRDFTAGAGCEAGFFQAFGTTPNKIFALALFQDQPLLNEIDHPEVANTFNYSSTQIYSAGQSPCSYVYTPSWAGNPPFSIPNKISTYPVPLNSPATTKLTTTGHRYSATIKYDGSNVTFNLYDIDAGGACPGTKCFTHTWTGVNIPSLIGGSMAWVGITGGCNFDCPARLNVHAFEYRND